MEKISEVKGVADLYLNDENQSLVIKFKEKEDYPHFKVLLEEPPHQAIFLRILAKELYGDEFRGRTRSEQELRELFENLKQHRKRYIKEHRGSAYSRKLYHYINMLEYVLGDSPKEKLGGFFIFFDRPKNEKDPTQLMEDLE